MKKSQTRTAVTGTMAHTKRSGRRAGALALAAGLAGALGASPALAQNDRILDTPTGWEYYFGTSAATIDGRIGAGLRPFFVNPTGSGTYDAILVSNSGAYALAGTDVVYNTLTTTLASFLTSNTRRPLELNVLNGSVLGTFNATSVTVPNSGGSFAAGATYTFTQGSVTDLVNWATNNTVRVIDMDKNPVTGAYSAVGVDNVGANAQGWWWYFNITATDVANFLTTNGARLTDIVVESGGTLGNPTPRFSVIMVSQNNGSGIFDPEASTAEVADLISNNGMRLTVFERFVNELGQTRFAVALVDNTPPEERRIRNLMDSRYDGIKTFGRKRVGGDIELAFNIDYATEPASSMKIVHAAYAMDRVDAGLANLTTTQVFNESTCGPTQSSWNNACPDNVGTCNPGDLSLGETLRRTMENSDNMCTQAMERFAGNGNVAQGRANLNNWMALLGFGSHNINHTLGCLCGQTPNVMSVRDFLGFYEIIDNGSLFSGVSRNALYDRMNRWSGSTGVISNLITQEAANTDLTASEIADFRSRLDLVGKAGGYGCNGIEWRGYAGRISIPTRANFQGSALYLFNSFSGAMFVQGATAATNPSDVYTDWVEVFREPVRNALQSWDAGCTPPTITSNPANATRNEGDSVTFSSGVGGTNLERSLRWQRSSTINGPWTNLSDISGLISGSTTTSLTLTEVGPSSAGFYRLTAQSACGSIISNGAQLTVLPCTNPIIINEPSNASVPAGQNANFSVSVTGSTFQRAFQWQKQAGPSWTNLTNQSGQIAGATSSALTLLNIDAADAGAYRVIVTNYCGSDISTAATLTVTAPGPTCDSLDFNQDGDFPTPLDLEDFIAANAGNICGTCSTDLDFNNDGDFPTPLDIEAFISVNAGGPCL